MAQVIQTRTSLRDLDNIWDYIAENGSAGRASRFIKHIRSKLTLLAENPLMGRKRDDLGLELRSFPVGNYLVVYQPAEDGVTIVRVVHGRQDIEKLFH